MNDNDEPEWLLAIDLTVDSYAPEQIADELGRRHAPYLREAHRLVLDKLSPDEGGLADGVRAETRRYLTSQPWLGHAALAPAVASVEGTTLAALNAIVATASPTATPLTTTQPVRPIRRLTLQPSATIVGNMAVRKKPAGDGVELSWDTGPNITAWTIRVSVRPDPRQDYVEGELVTLAPATGRFDVALDELPRRIQLYGLARDGRIVRRAIVSALTSGNSGAQWKRQATAS
ncbi:MAG: hypothetical protein LH654_08595 [Thermoleophilia bacterium]|nr:hypothetical protein [Thermoleophilia bacterium]